MDDWVSFCGAPAVIFPLATTILRSDSATGMKRQTNFMNRSNEEADEPTLSPSAMKLRDRFRELTRFRRTIIHELGHAVVATYLGQPLLSVTIEGDGDLAGACRYEIAKEDLGNNQLTANQAVVSAAARSAVVHALLGHEMTQIEFICSIDSMHDEYKIDMDTLRGCAEHLKVPPSVFDLWAEQQFSKASEILDIPHVWKALMLLAKELKREGTLSGTRVYQVLDGCKAGSL